MLVLGVAYSIFAQTDTVNADVSGMLSSSPKCKGFVPIPLISNVSLQTSFEVKKVFSGQWSKHSPFAAMSLAYLQALQSEFVGPLHPSERYKTSLSATDSHTFETLS